MDTAKTSQRSGLRKLGHISIWLGRGNIQYAAQTRPTCTPGKTSAQITVRETGAPGEAETMAGEARGFDVVAVAGGDGTVNEVVNGFFDGPGGEAIRPDGVLAVLPMGTGGDFRRMLSHGTDIHSSARALPTATRTPIDIGRVEFQSDDGQDRFQFFLKRS